MKLVHSRWSFAIVLVVAVAASAALWANARSHRWQSVQSADGRFRIAFPANPTVSQEAAADVVDGSEFVSHRLTASPRHDVIYAVSWWENPSLQNKTVDELFAHLRECDIKTFHGNIANERRLSVQGYPALDTEISGSNSGFAVTNRVVSVGPRIYSMWVIEPAEHRDKASIKKFFDSFSLL